MPKIRIANNDDYQWIIATLIDGFQNDELFNYYVRDDEKRAIALFKIFDFLINEIAQKYCEIWVLENNVVAIIIPPNVKPNTNKFFKLISTFSLACGFKKITRLLRMALLLPKHREKSPHYYVWFLAAKNRGQGMGRALLKQIIEKYGFENKIALETCSKRNVEFYSSLGFKLQEKFKIANNSPDFYTMLYEDKKISEIWH